jgi:hypothetical protein
MKAESYRRELRREIARYDEEIKRWHKAGMKDVVNLYIDRQYGLLFALRLFERVPI